MKTFKRRISITACSFVVLHLSVSQNMQAIPTINKGNAATIAITGLMAATALYKMYPACYLWWHKLDPAFSREKLKKAIIDGDEDTVKRLLKQPNATTILRHANGSFLRIAARAGKTTIAQLLLDHGAQADTSDYYGLSPLHLAAAEGHYCLVQLLLDHGVKVDTWSRGERALHAASLGGHYNIVQLLLENGAEANATNLSGRTPLHEASRRGCCNMAQLLLKYGANVNATDHQNQTPLCIAIMNHRDGMAKVLVKHGAELARIRNFAEYQNNPELRRNLEHLSRERLETIDNHWRNQLHDQGLYNDIINGCILPLALPQLQLNELAEIRQANRNWETHKDLYESIE